MRIDKVGLLIFVGLLLGSARLTQAAIVTLPYFDSGHYASGGFHSAANEHYLAGRNSSGLDHRNWFAFDLSSISATILAAELRVQAQTVNFQSAQAFETLTLFEVTTPFATVNGNYGVGDPTGLAVFGDLGNGTIYGSRNITAADNGLIVSFALNSNAVSALNNASGLFVMGGSVTTLDNPRNNELVFFGSIDSRFVRELVLTTPDIHAVPEPSSFACVFGVLLVNGIVLTRRQRRAGHVRGRTH